MTTVELEVAGMTCLDCSRHITRALQSVEGVVSASVDYLGGRATVEVRPPVAIEKLIVAVDRAGYKATQLVPKGGERAAGPALEADVTSRAGMPSVARSDRGSNAQAASDGAGPSDFDVLIIGTGGAGVAAAIQAVGMGARVGIVESGTLGGTCVNVGCIPSKNLIEAASHYHAARRGFPGVAPCSPALDWTALLAQKRTLVDELRQAKYADVLASYPGIVLLQGHARLLGAGRVRVGEVEHRAKKVILATGTSPSLPPIPGLDGAGALDSTAAMELSQLPSSMIVLGGSAVGLELGQTFARFGTRVVVLELQPRLLAQEDGTISEALRAALEQEGMEIHTSIETVRVERDADGVVVHVREGSLAGTFRADELLVATGRRANTGDLGLKDAGVALTERGYVQVDATMRTTSPDVYAAGDVTGGPGYVYVAAAGGRVAAENAVHSLGPTGPDSDVPRELDLGTVPNVTFTVPQVGSVGLTESAAREAGYNIQISTLDMAQVPRAIVSYNSQGVIKMVAEAGSGRLLGIHAVAANAGEFMGEAALALRFGLTARDLAGTLHPYLTWVESIKLAAQGFSMDVSKLSCCA